MLTTSSNFLNILIAIFIYSWIVSIIFGLVISISYPIFKKTDNEDPGAFVPIYNLFLLCKLNGYSEKYGLLFLIPGVNLIMMMLMAFKLKDIFKTDGLFSIGLLFLPEVFIPVLAYGNYGEEKEEKEENTNVAQEEPVDIDVDSIFKTPSQVRELESKPYRAKKVQVNEKFINSAPAEAEKIEKVEK